MTVVVLEKLAGDEKPEDVKGDLIELCGNKIVVILDSIMENRSQLCTAYQVWNFIFYTTYLYISKLTDKTKLVPVTIAI